MVAEPFFLHEPPLEGKPPPERRRMYFGYLMYQLDRGTYQGEGKRQGMRERAKGGAEAIREMAKRKRETIAMTLRSLLKKPVKVEELAKRIGTALPAAEKLFKEMNRAGLIACIEQNKHGRYLAYGITEKGIAHLVQYDDPEEVLRLADADEEATGGTPSGPAEADPEE